jgi:hypothetical protein
MTTAPGTAPVKKKKRLLKWIVIPVALLALLVCATYFTVGSNFFIQKFVLPRIEQKSGTEIEVKRVKISLFRGISVTNIAAQAADGTRVTAESITVRYNPLAFLGGGFDIHSLQVKGGSITAVVPPSSPENKPMEMNVSDLDIELKGLKTGGTGTLTITATLQAIKEPDLLLQNANININAKIGISAPPKIQPNTIDFHAVIDSLEGRASGSPLDSVAADIRLVASPGQAPGELQIQTLTAMVEDRTSQLLNFEATGTLNPESHETRLQYTLEGPDQRLLNTFGRILGDWSFGALTSNTSGTVAHKADGTMQATGKSEFKNLQIRNPKRGVNRAPNMSGSIRYDLTLKPEAKTAELNTLTVDVRQFNDRPMLDINLESPAKLSWDRSSGTIPDKETTLNFKLSDFDITLLNLVRKSADAPVNLQDGLANIEFTAVINGRDLDIAGSSSVKSLALKTPKRQFSRLNVNKTFNAKIRDLTELTAQAVAETYHENQLVVKTKTNAQIDLKHKTGTMEFQVVEAKKNVFDLLTDPSQRQVVVENFDLSGKTSIEFDQPNQRYTASGLFTINEFVALDTKSGTAPPANAKISFIFEKNAGQLTIENIAMTAENAVESPIDAKVSGVLILPSVSNGSEITLESETIDIDVMQKMAMTLKNLTMPPKSNSAEPLETAGTDESVSTTTRPEEMQEPPTPRDLAVKLELKNVAYRKILADSISGDLRLTDQRIEINNVISTIQDGNVRSNGYAIFPQGNNPGALSLTVDLKDIMLQPFAESFVSKKFAEQVQGRVSTGDLKLESSTLDPAQLKQELKAEINAEMDVLSIEQTDWLSQLSRGLGVNELETVVFNHGALDATLENATINVQRLKLTGKELQMRTSGQAKLGGNVEMETGLAFAGGLLKKVARGELAQHMIDLPDQFQQLPAMLQTSGETGKPKINVTKFIKDLALVTGREALREKIREKTNLDDEQIDEGLKLLEEVLGGPRTPETDKTETDTENQREKRRQLIRGLIDEATK